MRFAASIGVKDEVEMVGPCIRHLRAIGVELILLWDLGSTDGTLDVIRDAERSGDVWLNHVAPDERARNLMARQLAVAQASGIDRWLFGDADEFLLPTSGSLHEEPELMESDLVAVARHNVLIGGHGPLLHEGITPDRYHDVTVIARGIPEYHDHMARHQDDIWIRGQELPKVIARPLAVESFVPGGHTAALRPGTWRGCDARRLLIAHLPFTTWERFLRKVENIRFEYARRPDWFEQGHGWQWLRWVRLLEAGRLREEFDRQVLGPGQIDGLREEGVVRSVAELLAEGAADEQDGGPEIPAWCSAKEAGALAGVR